MEKSHSDSWQLCRLSGDTELALRERRTRQREREKPARAAATKTKQARDNADLVELRKQSRAGAAKSLLSTYVIINKIMGHLHSVICKL